MRNSLLILFLSIVFLLLSSPSSLIHARQKRISEFTKNNCVNIQKYINQFESFEANSGTGTVAMLKQDYSQFERNGCKVEAYGKLSKGKNKNPNLDQYFKDNKWEPILMYMADGHGSGAMGYFKEDKYNEGTFCLESHGYNISEDEEPTHLSLEVICVNGRQKLVIE